MPSPKRWRRRRRAASEPPALPCDGALLRRIHILLMPALEEECFHVLGEEAPRLRIHDVQPVVIDQHGLLLHPEAPALLAEALDDAGADRAGKGRPFETGARLAAADAGDCARHGS